VQPYPAPLAASVVALVMPVSMNARICGHQAPRWSAREPGDLGDVRGGGILLAIQAATSPVASRALDLVPHPAELLLGQPFPGAQQPPAAGSCGSLPVPRWPATWRVTRCRTVVTAWLATGTWWT
jgi:hypothetical protein